MGVTEETSMPWRVKLAWALALLLYGACWVLPILGEGEGSDIRFRFTCPVLPILGSQDGPYVGYDGACFAHESFWDLITTDSPLRSMASMAYVFGAFFISIGWLANELFVLGIIAALLKWPRASVRLFGCSLGIMISWQLAFLDDFPLLIGYWFWVGAGATALWLAAAHLAHETRRSIGATLVEPMSLAVIVIPILNAAIATTIDGFW